MEGCRSHSGALLALPVGSLLTLGVADWSCDAQVSGDTSQASARSALVDLGLDDGRIVSLSALEGRSRASYAGDGSHGDGVTDAVDLSLLHGAVTASVLHTEASSDGTRRVEVARVNDLSVLGSDRSDGGVPVDVPGVASVTLLDTAASGGIAGADVGTVSDVLSSRGQAVGLLATTASGGPGTAGVLPVVADVAPPGTAIDPPSAAIVNRPIATAHGSGPGVPLTGVTLGVAGGLLVLSGAAAIALAAPRKRG